MKKTASRSNLSPFQDSTQPITTHPGFASPLLAVVLLLLAVCVVAACRRELNFDEMLSVRVGWLLFTSETQGFHLAMPYTVITGAAAHIIDDPRVLFAALRIIGFGAFILCAFRAARYTGFSAFERDAWLSVMLTNGGFLNHIIEVRYDLPIVTIYLAAAVAIFNSAAASPMFVGLCLGLLAVHHLKGLLLACGLFVAYLIILSPSQPRSMTLLSSIRVAGYALLVVVSWYVLAWAFGFDEHVLGLYLQFLDVSRHAHFLDKWSSLFERMDRDSLWWTVVGILALLGLAKTWTDRSHLLRFSLVVAPPVLFTIAHPHPWAYSVIYIVPVFSIGAVKGIQWLSERLKQTSLRMSAVCLIGVPILLLMCTSNNIATLLQSDWHDEMEALRYARRTLGPSDRVVDPAGFLYFAKPADPEWYTDSLVRQLVALGRWQHDMAASVISAEYAVESYRLAWLPPDVLPVLRQNFMRRCGPILAHIPGDSDIPVQRIACPVPKLRLINYW